MIAIAAVAFLSWFAGQDTPTQAASEAELVRTVDADAYGRCVGALVGFSNVPMQCTVSEDGSLRACQLTTRNRNILRYKRRFECMGSTISVAYADGTPAVGQSVSVRLSTYTPFYGPN